uniref:Homeobox domain-containing protein n=1 Tax=Terrapene triunguis TaxID=2587831 RepID=A0A674JL46_9SAUR
HLLQQESPPGQSKAQSGSRGRGPAPTQQKSLQLAGGSGSGCCGAAERQVLLPWLGEQRRAGPRGPIGLFPHVGHRSPNPPSAFAAPEGGWVSADESSGYESESAASCIPSSPGEDEPQQRRARTAFTPEQVGKLEKTFKRQKYVGAAERRKLAAALQLSEIQVSARPQSPRHRDSRAGGLWAARHGMLSIKESAGFTRSLISCFHGSEEYL